MTVGFSPQLHVYRQFDISLCEFMYVHRKMLVIMGGARGGDTKYYKLLLASGPLEDNIQLQPRYTFLNNTCQSNV